MRFFWRSGDALEVSLQNASGAPRISSKLKLATGGATVNLLQ
jgi:hypothetical protein